MILARLSDIRIVRLINLRKSPLAEIVPLSENMMNLAVSRDNIEPTVPGCTETVGVAVGIVSVACTIAAQSTTETTAWYIMIDW